jgi:hypothetical protein
LLGGTKEHHKIPQSAYLVSQPRSKEHCLIKLQSVTSALTSFIRERERVRKITLTLMLM